jgi:hypothetical protein
MHNKGNPILDPNILHVVRVVLHRSGAVRFSDFRNNFVLFYLIAVILSLGAVAEICGRRRDMKDVY